MVPLSGAERAEVSFEEGRGEPAVADAIFKAGFVAGSRAVELSVTGMTCATYVGRVEKALLKGPRASSRRTCTAPARRRASRRYRMRSPRPRSGLPDRGD